MFRRTFFSGIAALFCAVASPCFGDIIWDYSPVTTGGSGSTGWTNVSSNQNFAELVSFADAVTVTGMDIYSSDLRGSVGDLATIRIRSDAAGLPGSILFDFTETISAIDSIGATAGNNRKHVDFTLPVSLAAGTPYWIGMSGTGFDLTQMAFNTSPPADAKMAQFSNTTYQFLTSVGDMAFRLHGSAVPEPSSIVLLGLGTIGLVCMGRRKRKMAA